MVLLISSQFSLFELNGGQSFGTVLLAMIFIWSIVNLSIAGTVYSLAFLIIINAITLKIGFISPWVILSIALLFTNLLDDSFTSLALQLPMWAFNIMATVELRV